MSRITTEYTYTDGYYFCNVCDTPHEDDWNAEQCFIDCYRAVPPLQRLAEAAE